MGAFDHLKVGQVSHGYYGNHTSTIDWCEQNYTHTPYIAEFYNALTNFPTIFMGLYGCYMSLRGGLRRRHAMAYLGLTGIGLGSFGFHSTLKWEWQLLDELPMIYLVSYCAYLVIDTLPEFRPRFGLLGPLVLVAWDIFVTLSYIYLPNPIYHQLAFGFILLSSVTQNFRFIRRLASAADANPAQHAKVVNTLLSGIATFIVGFIIWNVDNYFCDVLRRGQELLGPLGFILQGHGYWHLMTGYGSFLIMTASTYLQLAIKTSPELYDYDGSAWFPTVHRTKVASKNL
ncbi:ceramidase [Dioszegia hungarica]|uniref:Ceramidase n=1 Tax=Dioszegia hungarica TaxID=4972 RepID=A0AA38H1F0_9TREE|nr:ceramidase [Dioszegia hungarica]KAI9631910.1 ceramidase [Dioszegia hungarica]